jgi:hypothetical protein
MALRFRRTMKIAPGVRLNLTKTGVSARVGPRGAGVTVGTSGTTVSAGIPGTGLHVSEKVSRKRPRQKQVTTEAAHEDPKLGFAGWAIVLGVIALMIWGVSALLG